MTTREEHWDLMNRPFRQAMRGIGALAIVSVLVPSAAWAQQPAPEEDAASDVERARRHFLRGVEFYRESDYRAAIIEFERAYKTAPNHKVLYNLGQAHLELQDYAAARDAFERFLLEGGDNISAEQRTHVQKEIDKLSGRVARVRINVDVPGATVLVDDVVVGETPLDNPITLSTGRRRLTLRKHGHMPVTQQLDVAGGDNLELSFTLSTAATDAPAAAQQPVQPVTPDRPEPVREETGMGTPFWVSLAATGVFASGAGVFGYLALDAKADNEDQLKTPGTDKAELEDSKSATNRYALGTDILLGATLVAGGLTVYFALDRDDASSTQVGVSPGGATVRGTF